MVTNCLTCTWWRHPFSQAKWPTSPLPGGVICWVISLLRKKVTVNTVNGTGNGRNLVVIWSFVTYSPGANTHKMWKTHMIHMLFLQMLGFLHLYGCLRTVILIEITQIYPNDYYSPLRSVDNLLTICIMCIYIYIWSIYRLYSLLRTI